MSLPFSFHQLDLVRSWSLAALVTITVRSMVDRGSITPIEIANYSCSQETNEANRRHDTFALRTNRCLAGDAGGYLTRWKAFFDSRILGFSPLANARGSIREAS